MFSVISNRIATAASKPNLWAIGALLLFLTQAAPVDAQTPTDMVRAFVEFDNEYVLVGDVHTGLLKSGEDAPTSVHMQLGEVYTIVGYCDDNCTDLDLVLIDPDGNEVDGDYMLDAEPIISFGPDVSGQYEVRAIMITCSMEPCEYAVGMYKGGLLQDFGFEGSDWYQQFNIFREELLAEGFSEIGDPESGSLNQRHELRIPVEFQEGLEYQMIGACDNDCTDFDLILYDLSGEVVVTDVLTDAVPILNFTAPTTGEYRLAIIMVACSIEPCAYEIATFAKGEGMGPGGTMITGEIVFEETYQGRLERGDEQLRAGEYFDEYSIEAEAGQTVIVDLRSSDFDTFLIVDTPWGETERNDDFGSDVMHSQITIEASESGTFAIIATSFSEEVVGDYVLQIAVTEGK